jgi:ubiquinone biosynthesis accessory factor UbiK
MVQSKQLDEISARIKELLKTSPAADIEKNIRAMLAATFARLDLVTREEFDVQTEVLSRGREKISQLEARLAELEKVAGLGDSGRGSKIR